MPVGYGKKDYWTRVAGIYYTKDRKVHEMRKMGNAARYLLLVLVTLMLMTACSSTTEIGAPPSDAVCSSLVDAKCVRCHYKTRICDALGTKSVRKWKQTIEFMVKQGVQLSEDERNQVVACLASLPKGSEVVC